MPDDKEKPKQPETIEEEAGLPENWIPVQSAPLIPGRQSGGPVGAPPSFPAIDNFQSGQLPPFLGLSPDLVNAGTPGPRVPTTRLMPIMPSGVSQNVSATVSVVKQIVPPPAPTPAPVTPTSDGLIHGDSIWDVDDALFNVRDDFSAVTTLTGNFTSQIYWSFTPSTATSFSQSAAPPYFGGILLPNSSSSSDSAKLVHGINAAWVRSQSQAWALFDYPSWKLVWEFEICRPYVFNQSTLPVAFSWTQVSTYVGMAGFPSGAAIGPSAVPRTPYFIGLRYDTDTTSPAISDTDFVFEAVANSTDTATRASLNVQGTVVHTGIIPAEGAHYRLEMTCTVAGTATLTLSDGTTTFSSSLVMPKFVSTSSSNEYYALNGIGQIDANVATMPSGPGTLIGVSGIVGPDAAFNGAWPALGSGGTTFVNIIMPGTIGLSLASSTITCYPAMSPYLAFGNDSQATPAANTKALSVDFFSFVWNPGVAGITSATPSPLLPRYF